MRPRRPVPEWARRRAREREAEDHARAPDRVGRLMDLLFVDVVWSNDTLMAYHPRCRAFVPVVEHGTIDIAVDPTDRRYVNCGHCGEPLAE